MGGASREPERRSVTSPDGAVALRFSVLGPVRAWRGDALLPLGSPQQRGLLAALLLREGRTATAAELIDALWGDDPPSQGLAAVRTYASRLRKVLDPGVLVSESGGYAIRGLGDGALDLTGARDLARRAETARRDGDLGRARDLVGRALALWEGESLSGVPGPFADNQRMRIEEWRLQLLETRLEMALEQGHHAETVSELTALTAAHPLRERLRELLMLALYRSGRQAEALAVYVDTRQLLAEELGIDPAPALTELRRRILVADPALADPSPAEPEPSVEPVRPAQLPADIPDFTGHSDQVAALDEALTSANGRVMAVAALAGIGGVGKTTLALHVAHRARPAFPDGQLYADLHGASTKGLEPAAALASFLRALGMADNAIPDSLEDRAALYRSVLDGRRVLVLLDNARDAAQVRPLLPGTEGCAVLITSRARMGDLAGARLVDVDVLSPEEALDLFTRIVGAGRVAAEREAALDVVAACGRLPLAIRIAAARLAVRRTWTVSVLAAKLADERRRLDELRSGDLAVKATFELAYGQLEPAQARAFCLLGLADGPDISLPAAASLLGLPPEEAEELLESVVDTSLLESGAPGRYRYHELLRLFARACAERDEAVPGERTAALSRLLDFYLATAAGIHALERPGDRLLDRLEPTTGDGLRFTDRREARDWLFDEAGALLCAAQQAVMSGELRKGADLLLVVRDLAEAGSESGRYESAATALRDAAAETGDAWAEARARVSVAHLHFLMGRFEEAEHEAREAARLGGSTGDSWATADALNAAGVVALYRNRHGEAEEHLTRAVEHFRTLGDRPGEAAALCNLSRVHLATGRTASAVALARRGTGIYDTMGNFLRGANGRYALALALAQSGELDSATDCLEAALKVFRDSRQPLWEGMTLFRLAEVELAARRPAQAAALAEFALTALRGIGGEWRRGNVLTLLGRALSELGQNGRAAASWRQALGIYERLRAPEADEARALLDGARPGSEPGPVAAGPARTAGHGSTS
ncbi:BTAD domain-containing putative transcriptional regulator [Streptomyces sp. NPDC001834]|uniref:AfsR/SARP family transcriptional regulator n=1 Tax=unclassified Streptomyces TaxID=2593676 RepID=UPI0034169A80